MTGQNYSGKNRSVLLAAVDILLVFLSGISAYLLRFGDQWLTELRHIHDLFRLVVIVAVLLLSSYMFDLYNLGRQRDKRLVANNCLLAALFSFLLLSILYFLLPLLALGRGLLALTLVAFVAYQFFWHLVFASHFSRFLPVDKVLIIGTGGKAEQVGRLVQSDAFHYSHSLVGYLSADGDRDAPVVPESQIIAGLDQLIDCVNENRVTHIVVAVEERASNSPMNHQLLNCKLRGIAIQDTPAYFEMQTGKLLLEHMDMDWLIFSDGFQRNQMAAGLKRLVDVLLALLWILFLLPFAPLIALLVKLNAPGPILYSQTRVGQWGREFRLYKFRTMLDNAEAKTGAVWAQDNDPRIGPIGRLLRKCRIDELPQLYNVLKGDMSFVGPRPERPEFVVELEKSIPFYAKRHYIKPGITGWAQISYPYGSSSADSYEKLRYDFFYFKNMTVIFDVIILLKTVKVVLSGSGGR